MSDLDKDMRGGRIRHVGPPKEPDDAARIEDVCRIASDAVKAIPQGRGIGGGFPSGGGGPGPRGERGPQGPAGSGGGGAGTQGNQGNQGPSGAFGGPQGNQGFQGAGAQGNQGFQGNGIQGPQGTGVQGPQGFQGNGTQGPQGFQGTGVQGPQGNQGFQGNGTQGPQGFQGTGVQGPQGNQGFQGSGVQGNQGFQGTGVQGPQGDIGPQGNQGFQGTGVQGPQGNQGFQGSGVQGAQGNQGFQGTGVQGPQGNIGPQGNQGFQGTGVQGPQGDVGPQGNQGFQGSGVQGAQGNQGFQGTGVQGPQGNIGPQGNQGFQGTGVQGPQGNIGPQGNQGNQGFQGSSSGFSAGVSTGGNTSGSTGTVSAQVVFAGINNITLSQSTLAGGLATITISGRDAVFGLGVSTGGNTSGNTGTTNGTIVLEGLGAVTLSQSTDVGSQATIRISVPNGIFGAGVSTGGNTSGTTGTVTGTLVLAGGNQITLSQSTDTGGATVTISGRDAVFGLGVSTLGNTSGDTGTTFGTIVLVASGGITLSQSTAAGSLATIVISAPATSAAAMVRLFSHPAAWRETNHSISNALLSWQKFTSPVNVTATRMELLMALSGASNSTGALTISVGLYTMSGSTASLSTSASRVISWTSGSATTVSSVYGGVSGTRYRTIDVTMQITPGDYMMGLWMRTTNNGSWSVFGPSAASIVGALDANETNVFLDGLSASSFTTAMPASYNVTDTNYVRTGNNPLRQGGFILAGTL